MTDCVPLVRTFYVLPLKDRPLLNTRDHRRRLSYQGAVPQSGKKLDDPDHFDSNRVERWVTSNDVFIDDPVPWEDPFIEAFPEDDVF